VVPDNNATEPDIRSYLSTAAKHGLGFFDVLVMLAEGEPGMPTAT
jgi:hypothetical protein